MSDDKYVPDHEMVRECWIDWSASCGIGRKTAYEEFERYTSEIKSKVWGVAYRQGRWDERRAQHVEQHPGAEDPLRELEVVIGLNAGEFTDGAESVRSLARILYENDVRVVRRGC